MLVNLQLLDLLLGHGHVALFQRAELKTLVNLHGNEVFSHLLDHQYYYFAFFFCDCVTMKEKDDLSHGLSL